MNTQCESTLTRHYETIILAREDQDLSIELSGTIYMMNTLRCLSCYFCCPFRMADENPDEYDDGSNPDPDDVSGSGIFVDPSELS
ncbi:hypothetical protein K435DRAFT_849060 [Dendrothele bispora CBS 962.96]|uniref:Uncharacterized protein n=1 Tax=Dendrothele bispora (strain CBS 962.96) TaxID=1314807 RepID=A0A4S8MUF6_DENBC|nr:hypothetical protein K435DRAFT_849060 [Dendrothele bispora CBS 962.96]